MRLMYEAKTAKCPICGSKYLLATGYCVKCQKKVAEPIGKKDKDKKKDKKKDKDKKTVKKKKENIIVIKEDFQILGTETILEAGDKIKVIEKRDF